jgi:hypothetical protein
MPSEFTLDPVSGIPDPPLDENGLLEWARELTKSLQRDHVAAVDRAETQVMMGYGTDNRPETTGSRRFHFDSKTGTLALDVEQTPEYSEWVPINNIPTYIADGLGVHVILSTSLPFTTPGLTGYFSFDEEVYDEEDYWTGVSPTLITIPGSNRYQVVFVAEITNLADTKEAMIFSETEGIVTNIASEIGKQLSAGAGESYKVKISYEKEFSEDDELKFYWDSEATFDVTECYCIVTPLTSAVGGGESFAITDHGELSGLGDDDHDTGSNAYIRVADCDARATFATRWNDLTDGGETSLHSHALSYYLDNSEYIYWRNNADTTWIGYIQNNTSDDLLVGNASEDTTVRGVNVTVDGSGVLALEGNTVTINSTTDDITLDGFVEIVDTTGLDMSGGQIYLDNAKALLGYYSGVYYDLIQKSGTAETVVGASNSHNILLATTGNLKLGQYGVNVRLANSGGTYQDVLAASSDNLIIGAATWTDLTLTCGTDMALTPGGDLTLNPGGDVYISDGLYANGGFDVSGSSKQVRLSYLGAAPASLGNGDIWMESDGLHIYYGGAEKVVAGV